MTTPWFAGFERMAIHVEDDITIHTLIKGSGPPLLLLHGYPQTHMCWRLVAPALAEHFTVVVTDLRGYGASSKPPGAPDHSTYAKRTLARDQIAVMRELGFERFHLAGHDRGARVALRLAKDAPECVERLALLDIVPTYEKFMTMGYKDALASFHWIFLAQPYDLPERMIGADPDFFLRALFKRWSAPGFTFPPDVMEAYLESFRDPAMIHATCEDYRAGSTIDLEHDAEDHDRPLTLPLLVLWGGGSLSGKGYRVMEIWRRWATDPVGQGLDCGHFLPEEAPEETTRLLLDFFLKK